MNKNLGTFLVFIALILLSVLVVNGLYFNTPAAKTAVTEEKTAKKTEDYITTNLSINQQREYSPDIVDVVLGFENESKNQKEAVEQNKEIVSNLMTILEEENLENVETQSFRVYPYSRYEKTDENGEEERVTYYKVNNQIKFTTKNLSELPVLLAELLDAGANKVVSLNYRLESNKSALNEVTELALNSLKEKSAFIAQNLNKENYRIKELNFGRQNISADDSLKTLSRTMESEDVSELPVAEKKVNINVSVSAVVELY